MWSRQRRMFGARLGLRVHGSLENLDDSETMPLAIERMLNEVKFNCLTSSQHDIMSFWCCLTSLASFNRANSSFGCAESDWSILRAPVGAELFHWAGVPALLYAIWFGEAHRHTCFPLSFITLLGSHLHMGLSGRRMTHYFTSNWCSPWFQSISYPSPWKHVSFTLRASAGVRMPTAFPPELWNMPDASLCERISYRPSQK